MPNLYAIAPMLGVDSFQLGIIVLTALLVGFGKTGIGGILMVAIPIMAVVFGGKMSTGIILPMLITGDILAVAYYHRHANWPDIRRLFPWTVTGLIAGILAGNMIDDRQFTLLIAVSVLICLAVLVILEFRRCRSRIPNGLWFYALTGLVAGFTTMIGNVAGPILSVFLLARNHEKDSFLGTSAWFFLLINLIKIPLQIFFWGNITAQTGLIGVIMIPVVLIGAVLGVLVIKRIPEKPFRWLVIGMTAVATLRLFFHP